MSSTMEAGEAAGTMTERSSSSSSNNSFKKKRVAGGGGGSAKEEEEEEDRISPTSTVVTTAAAAASFSFDPNNNNNNSMSNTTAEATGGTAAAVHSSQPPSEEEQVAGAAAEEDDDDEQEEEEVHLLGTISASDTTNCKIVGIQYYTGVAHPGEYVSLVREPHNPYDENAIRVDNMSGIKVGHVKRQLAAYLSPLIDQYYVDNNNNNNNNTTASQQQLLTIDASIPYKGSRYDLPLSLEFRGPDIGLANTIDAALPKRFKYKNALKTNNKKKSASSSAKAAAPKVQVQVHTKKLDWKAQQKQLDEMFQEQTKSQLQNLPPIEMPSQLLQLQLLPHQIDGIRWLVQRETSLSSSTSTTNTNTNNTNIPFYKHINENGKMKWFCEITNSSQDTMPTIVKGGILCDDMGLGKTIQAIGLILCNPPEGRDYNIIAAAATSSSSSSTATSEEEETVSYYKKPTKTAVKKLKLPLLHSILIAAGINNNNNNNKKEKLVAAVMDGIESGSIGLPVYYKAIAKPPPPPPSSSSQQQQQTPKTTLIVCPVSVIGNWQEQIESHVMPGTLRVALYHGTDRKENLYGLDQIDVLITSYSTLQYDYKNDLCKTSVADNNNGGSSSSSSSSNHEPAKKRFKGTSIFNAQFHRIILDEAHVIRNTKSKTYQACKTLKAERRTCLTGTPIQNKPEDIHSIFSFLNAQPFSDKDVFRRAIGQPIKDGDDSGLARLRAMMAHVALRRNKSTAQIELVDKTVELRSVTFPAGSEHKSIYDIIYESAKLAFQATMQGGDESALSHTSVFEILLRLRQACCSGKLVPVERLQRAEQVLAAIKDKKDRLTADEGRQLLDKLKGVLLLEHGDAPPECAICLENLKQDASVVLRACGHVFCQPCIAKVATGYHSNCPFCRQAFKEEDMIKWSAAAAASTSDEAVQKVKMSDEVGNLGPSPKLEALLSAIGEMRDGEKGVIFSQFTKFLDEVEQFLDANDFSFARIDGKKTATQRIKAMQEFGKEHGGPRFMLCSLHAAGTGINLTRGNHVFMLDLWWNSAVEKQAMDRVHRIGQRRKVRVVRFVAADSAESRMVSLQEAKECQAKGAFENLSKEEKRKARLSDVKKLLEL